MGGSILRHDPFFSRGAASQAAGWDGVLDRIEAERKTGCNDGWQNLFLEGMLRGLGGFGAGWCLGVVLRLPCLIFESCGTMALPMILDRFRELFERGTADRGTVQGLQLGGIGDQLDFFA